MGWTLGAAQRDVGLSVRAKMAEVRASRRSER
jgi:hypothetical protein